MYTSLRGTPPHRERALLAHQPLGSSANLRPLRLCRLLLLVVVVVALVFVVLTTAAFTLHAGLAERMGPSRLRRATRPRCRTVDRPGDGPTGFPPPLLSLYRQLQDPSGATGCAISSNIHLLCWRLDSVLVDASGSGAGECR